MKRSLVIFIMMVVFLQVAESQDLWKRKRYEAVAGLGTSQFFGDVGGFSRSENILGLKDISFRQTRFNVNGSLRYRITRDISVRLSLTYGMFHATDERGSNETRGLEARTWIFEPALMGEYYFIKSKKEGSWLFNRGRRQFEFKNFISLMDLYAFTGFGGLSYNVKGNDALLSKGMTDGGFTGVIPFGIGFNVLFLPEYNLGLEIGARYSFSDYLDGYTSQFSKTNDVYYFLSFTFTYKIPTASNGLPRFLTKRRF